MYFLYTENGGLSPKGPNSPTKTQEPTLNSVNPSDSEYQKNAVLRSNSSPEMSSSSRMMAKREREIEEEDEDVSSLERSVDKTSPLQRANSSTESSPPVLKPNQSGGDSPQDFGLQQQQHSGKGTTSPFRGSCEAIPEEIVLPPPRHGSLDMGSPDAAHHLELLHPVRRERTSTISVMTPVGKNPGFRRMLSAGAESGKSGGAPESGIRSGISPSFVFLQLCSQGFFGTSAKPLLLPPNAENSLKVF